MTKQMSTGAKPSSSAGSLLATSRRVCPDCRSDLATNEVSCSYCAGDATVLVSVPGKKAPSNDARAPEPTTAPAPKSPASSLSASFASDSRYKILGTLGRGGMGIVYKVLDGQLDEVIAIKVLDPLSGNASESVAQFKREAKLARRINHPYVARLYDLFPWRGQLAISQEYLDGESLESILADGPLPEERIQRYIRYIASALDAAHELGIVHQDLKPANILIDRDDRPHILDFGLAALSGSSDERTGSGEVFGTPAYMSPEAAYYPDDVDRRSDIYSLGIMLYRMATGAIPFSHASAEAMFRAHLGDAPPPLRSIVPTISPLLEEVVLRCLAKSQDDRWPSAGALYAYLDLHLTDVDGDGTPEQPWRQEATVLLVDDDALSRRMVGDMLRDRGAHVIEATDGYEGVERALADHPQMIFLDMVMPVLDGAEALRILKSNPVTREIPVVMMTALSDTSEESLLAKETGAAEFINKPLRSEAVGLLLEKLT